MTTMIVDASRFWSKVDASGDCWLWTACRDPLGYGRFGIGSRPNIRPYLAHRVAWQLLVGGEPPAELDHLCRVPSCVNPAHLEPVTHAENLRRGKNGALKVRCANGHPWIPENLFTRSNGTRFCYVCHKAKARARRAAR